MPLIESSSLSAKSPWFLRISAFPHLYESLVFFLAIWFIFLFQLPHGTDENWLQKLYNNFVNRNPLFEKPRMSNTSFVIQHFADKVLWRSPSMLSTPEPVQPPEGVGRPGMFLIRFKSYLTCSFDECVFNSSWFVFVARYMSSNCTTLKTNVLLEDHTSDFGCTEVTEFH